MNRSSHHKGTGQDNSYVSERKFPFPTTLTEIEESEKRRSPLRRVTKLALFSKLFSSSSRRDLKNSKKPSQAFLGEQKQGGSKHSATIKTVTSSTTRHLSHDAAQVFTQLRQQKGFKQRRSVFNHQQSERSMIGSVWEVPSINSSRDDGVKPQPLQETHVPLPVTRPTVSHKATSFRVPQLTRSEDICRTPSTRSMSYDTKPPARNTSVPPEHSASNVSPAAAAAASHDSSTNSTAMVEISPGHHQVLRGHQETLQYVREDKVTSTECLFCNDTVYAVNDAAMVFCPNCRSITPLDVDGGDGLALGFGGHDWLSIQREALNMN